MPQYSALDKLEGARWRSQVERARWREPGGGSQVELARWRELVEGAGRRSRRKG